MLYEKVLEMGNATFTNTENTDRKEWLQLRTTGIGGSDAGAIMGLNEYSTPLSVYLSKKGITSFDGNSATEWGNILEDPVRQKAKEDLGIQIEKVPGMFTSKEYPFMIANLDGLVLIDGEKVISGTTVSGLGGHEIKTNRTGYGFGKDEVPDSYYCQVQHYMAVTGLPFFILTVFIIEQYQGKHYVIPRNDLFIKDMIEAEQRFWNDNIISNIMPSPTGNDNETDLVKSLNYSDVKLPSECSELFEEKESLDNKIAELKIKSEAIKQQIMLKMFDLSTGDSDKVTATCGSWKITLNKQIRNIIDSATLKRDGLYEKYTKASESRVLRITCKK